MKYVGSHTLLRTVHPRLSHLITLLYLRNDSLVHILELERPDVLSVGDTVREEAHGISRVDAVDCLASEGVVVHLFPYPNRDRIWAASVQSERPQSHYPHDAVDSPTSAQRFL